MASPTPSTFLDTVRLLCFALVSSMAVILVAVGFSLEDASGQPPVWSLVVVVALALATTVVILRFGFRTPALAPATPPEAARLAATAAFQRTTLVRFALADTVGLVAIALAFVVEQGGLAVCILGVLGSILLALLFVWPGDRVVQRVQESLEREGGQSLLTEVLAGPPPTRG